MSSRKFVRPVTAVFAFAWLAMNGTAADGSFATDDAKFLPLQATLRNEAVMGWEQIRRVYVTAGTNRFAFVVPEAFRLDASNPSKVVLVQTDYKCFLAFRIIAAVPDREPQPDYCRQVLSEDYPGARILDEFSQSVGGCSGPAFDLQWTNSSQVAQSARVVFVPSKVGIVELVLLSQADKFADSKRFFDHLRWSYCSDQAGPIKPIQTPIEPPSS